MLGLLSTSIVGNGESSVRAVSQRLRRVVRFGLAAGTENPKSAEIMSPSERMPRSFALRQAVVDDADARSVPFQRKGNLESARERRHLPRTAPAPRNQEFARTIHLDVTPFHAAIVE